VGLAGLVGLSDDGWGRLLAPAHGAAEEFAVGGGEGEVGVVEDGVGAVAEEVMVLEKGVPQFFAQEGGGFD
jgi:hypothetical protein